MLSFGCILVSPMVKLPKPVSIVLFYWSRPALVWPMQRACRKRRSRLRVEGPLAPYFEPYSEYLADRGYSQVSYWKKTFLVSEFSRWLGQERIAVGEITVEHTEAFLRYNAQCRCPKRGDPVTLSGITGWLQESQQIHMHLFFLQVFLPFHEKYQQKYQQISSTGSGRSS